MKTHNILSTAIAAGLGLLLASSPAKALTYNDEDLLLGFRATAGSTTDYLIDIGYAGNFIAGGTFSTGSIVNIGITGVAADLSATYGAGWATNTNLRFGVAGTSDGGTNFVSNTLFASRAEVTPGTASTAWPRGSDSAQATPDGKIVGVGGLYATGTATANNPLGTLQTSAASTANTWAYFMPGGNGTTATAAFSYWNGGIDNAIESGGINGVIDLYQLNTGSGAGTRLGGFRLDPAGTGIVQFSSDVTAFATPVPEPASAGVLIGGLLGLIGAAQRRRGAKTVQA